MLVCEVEQPRAYAWLVMIMLLYLLFYVRAAAAAATRFLVAIFKNLISILCLSLSSPVWPSVTFVFVFDQ